jgi:hypothetical protein
VSYTNEIQKINREYFENEYFNKLENVDEENKFLDINDSSKLNQENINNLIISALSNVIATILISPRRRAQGGIYSLLNSTRPLKKNNILLQTIPKI